MSTQKLLRMLFFSCVLGACTIRIGPLDENAAPPASAPDEGSGVDPPLALDAAHQKTRQEEADRYIADKLPRSSPIIFFPWKSRAQAWIPALSWPERAKIASVARKDRPCKPPLKDL